MSDQSEYSWLSRYIEAELVPALERTGKGLLPYFPLASGLLTGKYKRGAEAPAGSRLARQPSRIAEADVDVIEALETFAADRGSRCSRSPSGGLAAMPTVASVIAGATSVQQVQDNVAAGTWQPTTEGLDELRRITA